MLITPADKTYLLDALERVRVIAQDVAPGFVPSIETSMSMIRQLEFDKSCKTCNHFWRHRDNLCDRWEKQVPEDAIPAGCGYWAEDLTPF